MVHVFFFIRNGPVNYSVGGCTQFLVNLNLLFCITLGSGMVQRAKERKQSS